jgi:CRP-like cAMP-binding protein
MNTQDRPENRLLAALPRDAYERIEPHLERRSLSRGVVLHRPGDAIRDLYFPIDCLVSITVTMRDGRTAETGVVGRREVVGINAFMGGRETTQTEYVAQVPGEVVRVPADPLREEFDRNKGLRDVLLKYTQAMIAQISQNAACNRLHVLEQRYARWLLEVRDRIGSDDLRLTHEFISEMLGVRRAGISELSGEFEARGIISQSRGLTRILDGPGLEVVSCECYEVVRGEYDRLLGNGAEG